MATVPAPSDSSPCWRDGLPVHPCADVFPRMAADKIAELAEDIREHGQQQPIALWRSGPDQPWQVLDGRNRLDALMLLGVVLPPISNGCSPEIRMPNGEVRGDVFTFLDDTIDPATYAMSANLHRRDLKEHQRAELFVRTFEAGQNDRAKLARSFNPTASKHGGSTKDPMLEQLFTEATKHDLKKRTVQRAIATVRGKVAATPKRTHKAPPASETRVEQSLTTPQVQIPLVEEPGAPDVPWEIRLKQAHEHILARTQELNRARCEFGRILLEQYGFMPSPPRMAAALALRMSKNEIEKCRQLASHERSEEARRHDNRISQAAGEPTPSAGQAPDGTAPNL